MKIKCLAVLCAAAVSFTFSWGADLRPMREGAMPVPVMAGTMAEAYTPPAVSEKIFKWVQSSARTNYYFNRQQICFAKDENDKVDTNLLIVPVLKTFDDVMIKDVVAKRRWNGRSLDGFDDFVGIAEYLTINLTDKSVLVREVDYLDSTWTAIDIQKPDTSIKLEDLSSKSLDGIFYQKVIDFAMRNQLKLAIRVNSQLPKEQMEVLTKAQEAYRAEHTPEKTEDNEEL